MPKKNIKNNKPQLGLTKIGTFESQSGTFIFSDPCYEHPYEEYNDYEYIKSFRLDDIKKGTWNAYVRFIKCDKIGTIYVFHNSIDEDQYTTLKWKKLNKSVTVDSGQMGIYDNDHFRNDKDTEGMIVTGYPVTDKIGDRWYGLCCKTTNCDDHAGCVAGGIVCSTHWKSNMYSAHACFEKNKVIAAKIIVISPEEQMEKHSEDDEFTRLRPLMGKTYIPENDDDSNPEQVTVTTKLDPKYVISDSESDPELRLTPDKLKRTRGLTKEEQIARAQESLRHEKRLYGEIIPHYKIKLYEAEPITKSEIIKMERNTIVNGLNQIKKHTHYPREIRKKYYGSNKSGSKHYDSESGAESPVYINKTFEDKYDYSSDEYTRSKHKLKNKKQ